MCLSLIWCHQGILILLQTVGHLLCSLLAGSRKDLVPAEIKTLLELGTTKGFKSFLSAQAAVPQIGTHHSTMCRMVGLHFPVGINRSDFLDELCRVLGSTENWQSVLETPTLQGKCLRHFSPVDKRLLLECQELPMQAIESSFKKVTAK